jgi:hypothetical protein
MDGRSVMLTPKGLLVIVLHFRISFRRSSGVGCVSAVRMPSPPALLTADASSAYPTHCMPPWTTGTEVAEYQYHRPNGSSD